MQFGVPRRYVYELFHKKKEISRELLDFCIREKVVDGNLMAKWKKPGYEFLCSLAAINKGSTNFGTTSVCRVPLRLRSGKIAPNVVTGCISCASCDKGAPIWWNSKLPEPGSSGKRAAPVCPCSVPAPHSRMSGGRCLHGFPVSLAWR